MSLIKIKDATGDQLRTFCNSVSEDDCEKDNCPLMLNGDCVRDTIRSVVRFSENEIDVPQ